MAKVYSESIDVRRKLSDLGVSEEVLSEAVTRGQAEARARTDNHPPMYRNLTPWGETTCALRESLSRDGWKRSDEGNLPFTVNADSTLAILVSTGDQNTGNRDASPCTKCSKGPRTVDAVESNQLSLLPVALTPEEIKAIQNAESRVTWMLLFYLDLTKRELRSELSSPIDMNREGQVADWAERIILTTMPFDGDVIRVTPEVPQTPTINVDVKLRSA